MSTQKVTFFRRNFIYFGVLTANLLSFSTGIVFMWAATIVPILKSNDTSINPLPKPPTTLESSWIVSSANLGSIVGPFLGGIIISALGKKKSILLLAVPIFIGNLIIAFSTQVWMFIISRFIMGLTLGCIFGVMTSFIGDIAEDKNRGLLGSLITVYFCIGGLFLYTTGPFISIKLFSLINLIPLILLYILFGFFVPETPYDLLQRNSVEEAKKSLALYRGKNLIDIDMDFQKLINSINKHKMEDQSKVNKIDLFKRIIKTKALLKGITTVFTILVLQGLSGMPAVGSYSQTIFDESGGSIKSIYSVMILGVVGLLSTISLSQLVDRLGRRILILLGYTFMALSVFGLGTYFLLQSKKYNVDSISWLPLTCLIIFTIAFNVEAGIPWILLTDMISTDVMDICSNIASFAMFSMTFVVSLIYPYLVEALGNYCTFYIFGGFCIVAFIFCFLFVPETKGKSIEEVHKILNKR